MLVCCSGSTIKNKQMFNIICELPETVARSLVPRMRVVKGSGKAINYLTPPRILLALVTAWVRRGRWFDDQVLLALNPGYSVIDGFPDKNSRMMQLVVLISRKSDSIWIHVFSFFFDSVKPQGRALYAAEADRIRNWAEDRTRFSFTDVMEMYAESTWVSVFSLSVVCAFIILSSTSGSSFPGT